jgi:hypothetical protein
MRPDLLTKKFCTECSVSSQKRRLLGQSEIVHTATKMTVGLISNQFDLDQLQLQCTMDFGHDQYGEQDTWRAVAAPPLVPQVRQEGVGQAVRYGVLLAHHLIRYPIRLTNWKAKGQILADVQEISRHVNELFDVFH